MPRKLKFVLRVNEVERKMISSLAEKLYRSQGDAIRFLIINAMNEMVDHDIQSNQVTKGSRDVG